MSADQELLERAYAAFNARDIDGALATMHPDVVWPNGLEGGVLHGRAAVREYWLRQLGLIDPQVDPVRFTPGPPGWTLVDVHQLVRDRAGAVLKDDMARHAYLVEDGLVRTMEIRTLPPG